MMRRRCLLAVSALGWGAWGLAQAGSYDDFFTAIRRDDAGAITALLRAHGRDGVPLYLVYPAGGGAPELLPQLLTEGIVLRAIGG